MITFGLKNPDDDTLRVVRRPPKKGERYLNTNCVQTAKSDFGGWEGCDRYVITEEDKRDVQHIDEDPHTRIGNIYQHNTDSKHRIKILSDVDSQDILCVTNFYLNDDPKTYHGIIELEDLKRFYKKVIPRPPIIPAPIPWHYKFVNNGTIVVDLTVADARWVSDGSVLTNEERTRLWGSTQD